MKPLKDNDWKGVKNLAQATQKVEEARIVRWENMRSLKRHLSTHEQMEVMQLFARKLSEKIHDRLACEKYIESILVWNAYATEEAILGAFIKTIFESPRCVEICLNFSDIALTTDLTDPTHDDELFSLAVVITCEIGLQAHLLRENQTSLRHGDQILSHLTTYLMSVSNLSNNVIRLALLHYFGVVSEKEPDKKLYNRLINRFGHSILNHLFALLFNRRTEAVALQFLLKNIPFILRADSNSQQILHEVLKYYMLKGNKRFSLFLKILAEDILSAHSSNTSMVNSFVQHLGALFKISADIKNLEIAFYLIETMNKFDHFEIAEQVFRNINQSEDIPELHRALTPHYSEHNPEKGFPQKKNAKRGRKPSLSTNGSKCRLKQVTFLGSYQMSKAS